MSAKPIIAGRLYSVSAAGNTYQVIAGSACEAIVIALDFIPIKE